MTTRLRSVIRRGTRTLVIATGALLLSAAAVTAATSFGTSSITTTGTIQVDGNATFDTDTLFVDATNNKVGIGTITPGSPLHVKQNAANSQILELARPQASTDQGGYLFFRGGTSGSAVRGYFGFTQTGGSPTPTIFTGALDDAIALRSEGPVQFGSGGDNIRMTVLSTGNVGIGDVSPAALFTVGNGDLFQVNSSGNVTTVGTIGAASSVANSDKLVLVANATGSSTFTGNLTTADLTAARSWSLPDASGNVVIDSATQTLTNKILTAPALTGPVLLTSASGGSSIPIIVKADGSQSANLQEWQNSVGAMRAAIDANGNLLLTGNGGTVYVTAVGTTTANLFNTTATTVNFGGQANAVNIGSATGTTTVNHALAVNQGASILTGALTAKGLVVKGVASQSANLQEWQDSASTVLGSIGPSGNMALAGSLAIGGGTAIVKHVSATGAVGNASAGINGNSCVTDVVSVSGAASGDTVVATPPNGVEAGLLWAAYVSAAGQVSVRLCNITSGVVASADLTWRVDVWKH